MLMVGPPKRDRAGGLEISSHYSEQCTTYELFISGIFHLIFLDPT